MFKRMILMNPDATPGGGATPTPAPAPAPAPTPPPTASFPTATSLLKLPNSPRAELDARAAALASRQPASLMPKAAAPEPPPTPAPAPAAPAAPEPPPTPAPAPAAPAAPEPPKKIKIGNQEYTEAELEAELARARQPQQPVPAPTPPAVAPAQDPNAVAAQRQQEQARLLREERAWTENRLPNYEPFVALNADEMEAIMVGGAEGAVALQTALRKTAAAAELNARKSIYAEIAPVYGDLAKQVQVLMEQNSRVAQEQAEARFFTGRTEYVQHADLCRQAAQRIAAEFPNEFAAMSEETFFAEVARQVDYNLTRQVQMIFGSNNITDWRQVRQQFAPATPAAAASAPQPSPAPAPAAPGSRAPTPTPFIVSHQIQNPATLPPVQVPAGNPAHSVQPPAVNAPAGAGGFPTGATGNFHHDVNARMRGTR